MQDRSNEHIGQFLLRRKLGSGGFATVYLAEDTRLGRAVAIKILHPDILADRAFVARFHAEAKAAAGLRHPNIVTIYEEDETGNGIPYIVMEVLEGRPLNDIMTERGIMPLSEALPILDQLASALDYLHARGVVHRDLKPANIIINAEGQATLMDFGVARSLGSAQLTAVGQTVGTPIYMAPEQVTGKPPSPAVDRYAIGVVTFEMLAGRPPFVGNVGAVMRGHAYQPPPRLHEVNLSIPQAVSDAVSKQLSKDPLERYPSVFAFATALRFASAAATPEGTIRGSRMSEAAGPRPNWPDDATSVAPPAVLAPPSSSSIPPPPVIPRPAATRTPVAEPAAAGRISRRHLPAYLAGGVALLLVLALAAALVLLRSDKKTAVAGAPASASATARGAAIAPSASATSGLCGASAGTSGLKPAAPVATAALLCADDFRGPDKGWLPVQRIKNLDIREQAGELVVSVTAAPNSFPVINGAVPVLPRFLVETEAAFAAGDASGTFGVDFRRVDAKNRSGVNIERDGAFLVFRREMDADRTLASDMSTAIRTDGSPNTLDVVVDNMHVQIYVNGQVLADVQDPPFNGKPGRVNLTVSTTDLPATVVQFRSFRLWALP